MCGMEGRDLGLIPGLHCSVWNWGLVQLGSIPGSAADMLRDLGQALPLSTSVPAGTSLITIPSVP